MARRDFKGNAGFNINALARANYKIAVADLRRALGYQQFTATTEDLLEKQQ